MYFVRKKLTVKGAPTIVTANFENKFKLLYIKLNI